MIFKSTSCQITQGGPFTPHGRLAPPYPNHGERCVWGGGGGVQHVTGGGAEKVSGMLNGSEKVVA